MATIKDADRDDFDVLVKGGGGGKGPKVPKPDDGKEPIGGEGGAGTDYEDDDREIVTKISTYNRGFGATLTPEESKALQEELGVPVELPGADDGDKYIEKAKAHAGQLSTGDSGRGKGALRRAIAKLSGPQIDWKSALKRFIGTAMSKAEVAFPARRHVHSGDYMTTQKHTNEAIENAVVAVDTSGSMSPEAIEMILTEIKGIITAKKVRNTQVVYFDDGIQAIDIISNTKAIFDLSKAIGGGGTDFADPLKYMDERYKKGKMNLAVFCTDGYANLKLPIPKYVKVFVWVILDNPEFVPPWGRLVVHISKRDVSKKK